MNRRANVIATACLILAAAGTSGGATWYEDGGDRLTDLQNGDGGWGLPTVSATVDPILGPTGRGLAEAYWFSGDGDHLTALSDVGANLLTRTNDFYVSDGYLAGVLDHTFGVTTYTDHVTTNFYDPLAAGTYDRLGAGTLYDAAGYVSFLRTTTLGNEAAWQIGIGLYSAEAAGADTTAWVAGTKAEINELVGGESFDVLGLGGAVLGLALVEEDFDPTTGQHEAASDLADLAAILAGYQLNTGGFTWRSDRMGEGVNNEAIQETAYALLALEEFEPTTYPAEILAAGVYLASVQLGTGGWQNFVGDPDGESNNVTGEALWAIGTTVPEPTTVATMLVGLAWLGGRIRRRKRAAA